MWPKDFGLLFKVCVPKCAPKNQIWEYKKLIPPIFAQTLGKHKKESYQTVHVFHSKFQSIHINLFAFNSTAVKKIWSPFHESKRTTFLSEVLLSYTNVSC